MTDEKKLEQIDTTKPVPVTMEKEEKKPLTLRQKLQKVQARMKAPKNLYNSFGKYSYRNAEGILEAFKPYGEDYGLLLTLEDDLRDVGGRIYVEAIAKLYDADTEDRPISVAAIAREAETKTGMDAAQITGAASSYARKYALNGLFLLDDTKDPDTDEHARQTGKEAGKEAVKKAGKPAEKPAEKAEEKAAPKPAAGRINRGEALFLREELKRTGASEWLMLTAFGVAAIEEMSAAQFEEAKKTLAAKPTKEVTA